MLHLQRANAENASPYPKCVDRDDRLLDCGRVDDIHNAAPQNTTDIPGDTFIADGSEDDVDARAVSDYGDVFILYAFNENILL